MSGGFYQDFWTIDSIQGYPIHLHPMLHPKVASSAWEETYLPLGGSGPTGGFLAKKLIFSNEISGGGGLLSEKWRCQVGMWDFSWWWGARKFFQNLVVVQRNEEGSTITYHLHQGSLYYQPKLHTLFSIFPQNPPKSPPATFEHHQLWSPSTPQTKKMGGGSQFFHDPNTTSTFTLHSRPHLVHAILLLMCHGTWCHGGRRSREAAKVQDLTISGAGPGRLTPRKGMVLWCLF